MTLACWKCTSVFTPIAKVRVAQKRGGLLERVEPLVRRIASMASLRPGERPAEPFAGEDDQG
jgi:hypothetical protein